MSTNIEKIIAACPQAVLSASPYIAGKPISELRREKKFSDSFEIIKLASNENPLGPSPMALNAVHEEARNLHIYPDSSCFKLKDAIARKLAVPSSQVLVGAGSECLIEYFCRALIKPGDHMVIAECSFPIYDIVGRWAGASISYAKLGEDFSQDVDAFLACIRDDTRLVIVGNPDNPTGRLFTEAELRRLANALPSSTMLLVDEAYHGLVTDPAYFSALSDNAPLVDGKRPIAVTRTFSKSYGLAGLRVAYSVMPPEICALLAKIKPVFSVNSLALAAAEAALDDDEHIDRALELISEGKKFVVEELRSAGFRLVEGAANYILVGFPGLVGGDISEMLLNQGIIVRPLKGEKLKHFCRLSLGTASENDRVVKALKAVASGNFD